VVAAPTDLGKDWLSTRLRSVVQQAMTTVAGPGLKVEFEVRGLATVETPLQPAMIPEPARVPLNLRFTFATFLPVVITGWLSSVRWTSVTTSNRRTPALHHRVARQR
jgi:chromosomal replication initiation ATPase DnaA